jgi:phosphoribosylaminoimidazole-succinocarboxamide synthase
MSDSGIIRTDFKGLNLVSRGKVRDMYDVHDHLLIVATDRISAFDVIMPNPIPGKGKLLTRMSVFWFDKMTDIIRNHLISTDVDEFPEECIPFKAYMKDRSMLVRKARPLPVECVVRGYLTGSGWKDYSQGRAISGITLPGGLKESAKLAEPIFTPSTKAEVGEHDMPIPKKEMENIIGRDLTERIIAITMNIYEKATKIADKAGIIIADTKMEFGMTDDGLILIDELLTPDSSRFWPKELFEEGRPQQSYDKQFLRDYLLSIEWDQKPPAPELPDHIIQKTREKYEEALKRLLQ